MGQARLRVGIAGAGWVAASRHVPAVLARRDAELVSIYDRDRARAGGLCEKIGAKHTTAGSVLAHSSLAEFLSEGLDVVHITSSPWSHHDLAVAALSAGSHVFVEKPMAMNSAQAKSMADEALTRRRLLCVSHNFLWSASMTNALAQLGGAPVEYMLGLQLSGATRRLPAWHRDLPGGLLFDEVPHMLYSANHLLGGKLEVEHVRATFDGGSCPRSAEVLLHGRTGQGQITMVFSSPVSEWHIMASSSERFVDVDLFRDIAIGLRPDGEHRSSDIARSSASAVSGHVAGFARAGGRWLAQRQFWGHDVLIGRFYDAVRGHGPVPVPMEDALSVVAASDDLLSHLGPPTGS